MATAQSGIFAVGTSSHCFLEFASRPDTTAAELVQALADLEEPHTTVGGVNLVLGVRPTIWSQVAPDQMPAHASDFDEPIRGVGGCTMPATQQDAWVWVSGAAPDLVFDVCVDIVAALAPVAKVATEVTGWSYRHSRDLTGFQDGTENPSLAQAPAIALIPDGQAGQGSSVVLVQEWIHDAEAWNALSIPAQEQVMGRTKADSIELDQDIQAGNSHVSRTVIEDDAGQELAIFRRNVPYGTLTDHGTMFVGFSFDPPRLQRMLERMAGAEDGTRDALTHYTTPLTGAYYIVPAIDHLAPFTTPEP
ncbi:MAG: Dyp-type peroxidase [Pseudonocardiales bacterium]